MRVAVILMLLASAGASATTLQWVAPTTCTDGTPLAQVDAFRVYRDRELVEQVSGVTEYTDDYVTAPGEQVCYEITAVGGCGDEQGESYYSNRGCPDRRPFAAVPERISVEPLQ